MNRSELRKRVERFASLQAAQRALAKATHPSELAWVREQGRNLLVQLQGLSTTRGDAQASSPGATDSVSLQQVDRALADQSDRTLAVLNATELAQLRASVPTLVVKQPEEVGGLVDLLLGGDLQDDKNMRTLEYLVTMLSTEERGGRRVIVRTPSEVRPRLRQIAELRLAAADEKCMVAERVFEDAATQVAQQGDLGEIRDRVRRYKEDLGSDILHPKVLAAVVTYNVAMFNCMAAEIDSSRAVNELAEALCEPGAASEPQVAVAAQAPSPPPTVELLGSRAFESLVAGLRAKVIGQTPEPGPALAIVELLPLDGLRPEDVEVFSGDEAEEATLLMRSAVVLGLVLRHLAQTEMPLRALGLEPERLATDGVTDLTERMTELARKQFADSRYRDAFRLSDVKTHSLAAHAVPQPTVLDESRGSAAAGAGIPSAAISSEPGLLASLVQLISPRVVLLGLLAAATLALLFGPPLVGEDLAESQRQELLRISPFLESGERGRGDSAAVFGGSLSRAWDFVGTAERREVVLSIGSHFAAKGVTRVWLLDADGQVTAIYSNGNLSSLTPRANGAQDDGIQDDEP